MTYFAEDTHNDFANDIRDDGFHGIQESITDCEIANCEAGEAIYCERSIADFMGQDAH